MTPRAAPGFLLALLGVGGLLPACSSSMSEQEIATRDEFYQRAVQYYDVGRYLQAEQQARKGLVLDEQDAMLNLIAGRALIMQATLAKLSQARPFLEVAREELPAEDLHKADFSLAQYHLIYGRELAAHVARERRALEQNPSSNEAERSKRLADLEEREARAREHWDDAARAIALALTSAPDVLQYLEIQGQIAALRSDDELAFSSLGRALEILAESRDFLNRTLSFNATLPLGEEERLRKRLLGDIRREIAIRDVRAGVFKRQGRLADEEREYTTMLQLDERQPSVYYSRGMVRYELGRIPEAAEDMREFLMLTELDPRAEQIAQAVEIIQHFERLQPEAAAAR